MDIETLQKQNADLLVALRQLSDAARPFTCGSIVDETSGTIPLMGKLGEVLAHADSLAADTRPAANAVAVPQSRDKDWGATWDAVFKALDPYTIGSGTRGEFNAAVNDVVVAVMANMAPATSENI